jgi:purine-binding chemotaxis protein CheW
MNRPDLDIVVFEAGGQRYGLPAADVREVLRAAALTPLPGAPAVIEGVLNVRGAIVTVLDLRARFRLPPKVLEPSDHLIVATAGPRVVALRADRALGLVRLAADLVEDPRRLVPGTEYVAGVAPVEDGLLLIHDLRTFLSASEAATLDDALRNEPEGEP